jgi:DNA-binding beta-propeller fold protein YncE
LEKISTFGSCGSAPDQLSSPRGIAFDPRGSVVYIADTGNRRVVAWPIAEGAPTLLPLDGLEEPVDIAVSAEGEISVLDTIAPKIVRWTPNSVQPSTTTLPAGFYRPRGLDTDSRGLVFVADTGGARVAVTDRDGGVVAEYGGPDSEFGSGQPVDVVSTGITMWAVTAEDGRLWNMDSLASMTVMARTDTINGPHLAQVDGSLFVSDPAGGRVIYLDKRGKPVASLAESGAFTLPTGVAAMRLGNDVVVAVSDAAACTVSVWRGSLAGLQP